MRTKWWNTRPLIRRQTTAQRRAAAAPATESPRWWNGRPNRAPLSRAAGRRPRLRGTQRGHSPPRQLRSAGEGPGIPVVCPGDPHACWLVGARKAGGWLRPRKRKAGGSSSMVHLGSWRGGEGLGCVCRSQIGLFRREKRLLTLIPRANGRNSLLFCFLSLEPSRSASSPGADSSRSINYNDQESPVTGSTSFSFGDHTPSSPSLNSRSVSSAPIRRLCPGGRAHVSKSETLLLIAPPPAHVMSASESGTPPPAQDETVLRPRRPRPPGNPANSPSKRIRTRCAEHLNGPNRGPTSRPPGLLPAPLHCSRVPASSGDFLLASLHVLFFSN